MKNIKMLELSISSVVIKCTSNKIFVKKGKSKTNYIEGLEQFSYYF